MSDKGTGLIIENVGYMWHRKYVNWENRQLTGILEGGDRKVDFADQSGIYVLYHDIDPVYIGLAGTEENSALYDRLRTHTTDRLFCMWARFSWYGFYSADVLETQRWDNNFKVATDVNELMTVMESLLIRICEPRFNLSRGTLGPVEWYDQQE